MKRNILLITALVFAVLVAYWWQSTSDEGQILKQLDALMELAEEQPEEQGLAILTRAAAAAKYFTDPCILEIPELNQQGSYTRKDLSDRFFMIRKRSDIVDLALHDEVIELFEDQKATVNGTFRIRGLEGDLYTEDLIELQLDMEKVDDWLISKVTFVQWLER